MRPFGILGEGMKELSQEERAGLEHQYLDFQLTLEPEFLALLDEEQAERLRREYPVLIRIDDSF